MKIRLNIGGHFLYSMKVLFLTNIPSPNRVAFFNEWGRHCDLSVTFELHSATDRDSKWVAEEIKYFKPIFLKGCRTSADSALCPRILTIVRKRWDYIIVGTYNTPTSMLAMQYMIITRRKYWIEADGGFIKKDNEIKYWIKHHFISNACSWLSSSQWTTKYLVHYGAVQKRCYLYPFTSYKKDDMIKSNVPHPVDRKMAKKELGIKEPCAVISVGSFSYDRRYGEGFDTLMKVAEQISDCVGFYFIGDDLANELIEWKEKRGLKNVHFIRFRSKEELFRYYIASDIFVLLSKEDVEDVFFYEAMANALPIIVENQCAGRLGLVEHGRNGFIVDVGDDYSIARYIRKFLCNPEMMIKFGKLSYEKIYNYTIGRAISKENYILGECAILKEYAKKRIGFKGKNLILCVSQVIKRKGIDILANAACMIEDKASQIYVVGGSKPEELPETPMLKFVSFKTGEKLHDYYRAADIFVLPTREDIWGLVINEAMAYGLPVITTERCGAGRELIKNGSNGYIVAVGSSEGIANSINDLLRNSGRKSEFGKRALRAIHSYTVEEMAAKHMKILSHEFRKD